MIGMQICASKRVSSMCTESNFLGCVYNVYCVTRQLRPRKVQNWYSCQQLVLVIVVGKLISSHCWLEMYLSKRHNSQWVEPSIFGLQ